MAAVCLCLMAGAPPAALAQQDASLDLGFTSISYDSTTRVSGFTVAPALQLSRSLATFGAAGTFSLFNGGGWSAQGRLTGSTFTPSFHHLRAEVAGVVGGSRFEGATSTAQMLGQVRVHLLGARQGAWVSLGGGQSWNGAELHGTSLAGVGAWLRRAGTMLTVSAIPTTIGGDRYTDATGSLRWSGRAIELDGSLTARRGGSVVPGGTWGGASATFWVSHGAAIVAGAGSYAPDPAQALPGGHYVTVSLRFAARPVHYPELHITRPAAPAEQLAVARSIEVRNAHDGQRVIRVRVAAAGQVELMGDFTDWRVVQLVRTAHDRWEITLPLPPGEHHFNLRVNGGEWGVPAGVPSVADEFEGRVGVLLVR